MNPSHGQKGEDGQSKIQPPEQENLLGLNYCSWLFFLLYNGETRCLSVANFVFYFFGFFLVSSYPNYILQVQTSKSPSWVSVKSIH